MILNGLSWNQTDNSVVFQIASKYCISDSFVDRDGYSITDFQITFLKYFGEISFHYPSNKLFNFFKNTKFITSHIVTSQPIPQADVFYIREGKMLKPHSGLSKNTKFFILNFALLNKKIIFSHSCYSPTSLPY